jgi:hypothetical protein
MIDNEKAELVPARETLAFLNFASVRALQVNANVNLGSAQGWSAQHNTIAVVQGDYYVVPSV